MGIGLGNFSSIASRFATVLQSIYLEGLLDVELRSAQGRHLER